MSKIIIEVSGGVVQAVNSDDPYIEVEVLDWDNYVPEEIQERREEIERLQDEFDEMNFNIYSYKYRSSQKIKKRT